MKKIFVGIKVSILVTALFVLPNHSAASCVLLTFEEQIRSADVVASGVVTEREKNKTVVEAQTVYKGSPENPIQVVSETPGAITSVDVVFLEGQTYLLLLRKNDDESYTTNQCNGTRNIEESPLTAEEIALLGSGTVVAREPENKTTVPNEVLYIGLGIAIFLAGIVILKSAALRNPQAKTRKI